MKVSNEQLKEFIADGTIEDEIIDEATLDQNYEEQLQDDPEEMAWLLSHKKRRKIEYNYTFDPLDFESPLDLLTEENIEKEKLRGIAELFDTSEDCPVKAIEYGDTIEVITSYNRADGKGFKKIKNLPGNKYQNLETGKISSKRKHEKRSEFPFKFRNSVSELERLIELNFIGSNGYFITLAYGFNYVKVDEVQKDFEKFYHRFHYYYGKRTNTKLSFIRVLEPKEISEEFAEEFAEEIIEGWHIHLLVKAEDETDLKITEDQIAKMWGNDNVYVCPISKSGVVSSEKICKNENNSISVLHMENDLMHFYNSNTKLFTCSQNIKRPIVHKMTRQEMKETVTGYDCQYDIITRFEKGKIPHLINAVRYEKYKKKE